MADLDKFTQENDFEDSAGKRAWQNPDTRYHILEDIFILLMEMTGWVGIYLAILFFTHQTEKNNVLGILCLPVFYVLSYVMRRMFSMIVGIILGHAALCVPILFIMARSPHIAPEITTFYLAVVAGCLAGSISHHRRGLEYMCYTGKWYLAVEVLVIFFWGVFTKDSALKNLGIVLGILLILFHIWCAYLDRINDYLAGQEHIGSPSKFMIFNGNTQMVTKYLCIIFLCMLTAFYFQNDRLFEPIKNYILYPLRLLLGWIGSIVRWIGSLWSGSPVEDSAVTENVSDATATADAPDFLNHIILVILGSIPYIILLSFAFRDLIRWLRKRMDHNRKIQNLPLAIPDEIEDLAQAEAEGFLEKWKKKIFRTNREKIRHLFKSRVKRGLRHKINASKTARILGQQVQEQNHFPMEPLTNLYERARYSEQEITKEDIRSIKHPDRSDA